MRLGIDITWTGDNPAGVGIMAGEAIEILKHRPEVELVLFRANDFPYGPRRHGALARAIKRAQLDALWQLGGWLPLFLPRDLFAIQTVHDLISFDHPEWFPQRGLSRWWSHQVRVARAIRRANVIHAVSGWAGEAVRKHFPVASSRIIIAYQGVTAPSHIEVRPSGIDQPFVLMLGTIEPRKNIEMACRAFALFAREHPEPHLVIAGKTGWKAEGALHAIETLSATFPGRIHRFEYVGEEIKWALLHDASVLLITSHAEGFGRPIVEAMMVSTPVLAAANSALQEIAVDAAIMVPQNDEQKTARALWRAIYHPTLPKRLAELGRERACQFSTEAMVGAVLKTIETQ